MASYPQNTYVGMRYVPLFDGDWDAKKDYEPLTVVNIEGNSYTSKTFVPAGVSPVGNPEYWAETGNYNAQIEAYRQEVIKYRQDVLEYNTKITNLKGVVDFIISEEEGSDITDILISKLAKGNVMLDGKKYNITSFTVPMYRSLYGNGSILTVTSKSDTAITIGSEESGIYGQYKSIPTISNLAIDCKGLTNGILVIEQNVCLDYVVVHSPLNYGIQIGKTNNLKPTDCNISNCNVYGLCDYGFVLYGTDNYVTNCRTLFCKKASFYNIGGGNYYTQCHALGITSDTEGFENCSGFYLAYDGGGVFITDCYADNCRYGLNAEHNNKDVYINGFYCYWYEKVKDFERIAVYINIFCKLRLNNMQCDNSDNSVTRLKIRNLENAKFFPYDYQCIELQCSRDMNYKHDDDSFLACYVYNHGNIRGASHKVDDYVILCGLRYIAGNEQGNVVSSIDIIGASYSVIGLSARPGNYDNPTSLYLPSKGILSYANPATKFTLALIKENNNMFLGLKVTGADIIGDVLIKVTGGTFTIIPADSSAGESGGIVATVELN